MPAANKKTQNRQKHSQNNFRPNNAKTKQRSRLSHLTEFPCPLPVLMNKPFPQHRPYGTLFLQPNINRRAAYRVVFVWFFFFFFYMTLYIHDTETSNKARCAILTLDLRYTPTWFPYKEKLCWIYRLKTIRGKRVFKKKTPEWWSWGPGTVRVACHADTSTGVLGKLGNIIRGHLAQV